MKKAFKHFIVDKNYKSTRLDRFLKKHDQNLPQSFVAHRIREAHRIFVIDTVHLGRLEHHMGVDLSSAQSRGGVGGEKGIAAAGTEDHHSPLLEMPHRLAADVRLRHLLHGDSALHPGGNTGPLQAVLQGDRIHHRGQHADVIGRGPLHAGS